MTVPARRVVEGQVVNSRAHHMTLGSLCLNCGQDATAARCEPVTFDYPPSLTIPGEVVQP